MSRSMQPSRVVEQQTNNHPVVSDVAQMQQVQREVSFDTRDPGRTTGRRSQPMSRSIPPSRVVEQHTNTNNHPVVSDVAHMQQEERFILTLQEEFQAEEAN